MKFSLFAFGISTVLAACNYSGSCYSVGRQSYSRPRYQTTKTYGGYGSSSTSTRNGASITQTSSSRSSNGRNGAGSAITVSNKNTEILPINENQIVVEQTQSTNGAQLIPEQTQYVGQTYAQAPVQTTQVIDPVVDSIPDPVVTEQAPSVTTTTTTGSSSSIKSTKPYGYSSSVSSRAPTTYTYSWSFSPRYSSRTYYKTPSYTTLRSTPCKASLSKRSKYDSCY